MAHSLYKKIGSLFIIFFLLANNAYAAADYFDNIIGNSLLNVTPGRAVQEVNGAGKLQNTTFTTTSVFFRFGSPGGVSPTPWFSFTPPKLTAGCGGISLKGMFASIIGLDQLEEQLKNAGTSIAWGIVVGLIYSLPGIGAALRMIDTWAKKIQQLLANACQSAANFTEAALRRSDGSSKLDPFHENAQGTPKDTQYVKKAQDPTLLERAETGATKFFKDNFDDNMLYKSSTAPEVSTADQEENWRKSLVGTIPAYSLRVNALTYLIDSMTSGQKKEFFKMLFDQVEPTGYKTVSFGISLNKSGKSTLDGLNIYSLSDLISANTSLPISEKEATGRLFTSIAIASATASDYGVLNPTEGESSLESVMDSLDKLADENVSSAVQTSAKIREYLVDGNELVSYGPVNTTPITAPIVADTILKYLTLGTNGTTATPELQQNMNAVHPLMYTIMAIPATKELAVSPTDKPMIYIIAASNNEPVKGMSWFDTTTGLKGAAEKSKILINSMLNGQDYTAVSAAEDFQLLVPGMLQKIKILQQSSPTDRAAYTDLLIKYNTYITVMTAFDGLSSNFTQMKSTIPVYSSSESGSGKYISSVQVPTKKKDKLKAVIADMNKALSDMKIAVAPQLSKFTVDGLNTTADGIEKIFIELDKKNKSEAIKVAPQAK